LPRRKNTGSGAEPDRVYGPPVIVDKLFEALKDGPHELADGPLVTLLTEAKGDLDTIPIDWAKMGLPGPAIELDKFLNLFDAS
jgi:hypothetical protein